MTNFNSAKPTDKIPPNETQTIQLEKFRVGLNGAIGKEMLGSEIDLRFVYSQVLYEVRGFIWARNFKTVVIKYPLNWWEAVKERWFYDWMLERWPVRYQERIIEATALYPEYNAPSLLGQCRIMVEERRQAEC